MTKEKLLMFLLIHDYNDMCCNKPKLGISNRTFFNGKCNRKSSHLYSLMLDAKFVSRIVCACVCDLDPGSEFQEAYIQCQIII